MQPAGFSWRELDWMAENRLAREWDQTAEVIAAVENVLRSERLTSDLFHPFKQRAAPAEERSSKHAWGVLKGAVLSGAFGG